jgi:hypothetical protein
MPSALDSILPPIMLKHITHVAIRMHNTTRKYLLRSDNLSALHGHTSASENSRVFSQCTICDFLCPECLL